MDLKIGRIYKNRTWKYLYPVLTGHGAVLKAKINTIFKLAVGIHDTLADGSPISEGRNIYILADKFYQEQLFNDFIKWIETQDYFKGTYCFDSNIGSRRQMIVLSIPEEYYHAYDNFLLGKYSLMYTQQQLNNLFSTIERVEDYKILSKHPDELKEFVKQINEEFYDIKDGKDQKITIQDMKDSEYDFPIKRCEEIFNCDEKIKRVYFNEKLDKVWN